MMKRLHVICLTVLALSFAFLPIGAVGQDVGQNPQEQRELMLGEWCGKADDYQYAWVHTINDDGTFSTYFESDTNGSGVDEPYWNFGSWSLDAGYYVEIVTSEQSIGGEKEFIFPPYVHRYEISKLTAEARALYYPDWDTTFVSSRTCDPVLS